MNEQTEAPTTPETEKARSIGELGKDVEKAEKALREAEAEAVQRQNVADRAGAALAAASYFYRLQDHLDQTDKAHKAYRAAAHAFWRARAKVGIKTADHADALAALRQALPPEQEQPSEAADGAADASAQT